MASLGCWCCVWPTLQSMSCVWAVTCDGEELDLTLCCLPTEAKQQKPVLFNWMKGRQTGCTGTGLCVEGQADQFGSVGSLVWGRNCRCTVSIVITSRAPLQSKNASQGFLTVNGMSFSPFMFDCSSGTPWEHKFFASFKNNKSKDRSVEVNGWNSPSWPEDSLSCHLLVPSPTQAGPREISEWNHPGQSECSSDLLGLNLQHTPQCYFNCHLPSNST